MKVNKFLAGIIVGVAMANPVFASNTASPVQLEKSATAKAVNKLEQQQSELLAEVDQKVLAAFNNVQKAVELLQAEGKEKQALAALEKAVGQFDTIMAARPELSLVPIQSDVEVSELITTPTLVKRDIQLAIDLLKDNKVIAARALLAPMQDDMVATTIYLPMATYPEAIKLATKALVKGDKDESLAIIGQALTTFVVKESVIPLGLIRAQVLIEEASKLDKEKDKANIKTLLARAADELEVAKLLGYTDDEGLAYEGIKDQISALQKEVDGKNVVEKLYKKLTTSFKKLIDKEAKQETKINP
jgi:hypothetical protein